MLHIFSPVSIKSQLCLYTDYHVILFTLLSVLAFLSVLCKNPPNVPGATRIISSTFPLFVSYRCQHRGTSFTPRNASDNVRFAQCLRNGSFNLAEIRSLRCQRMLIKLSLLCLSCCMSIKNNNVLFHV